MNNSSVFSSKRFICFFLSKCFLAVLLFFSTSLEAVYQQIYTTVNNGAITFTGNTLGLDKTANQNQPGISGSIGAFITTTNPSSQVGTFPVGTTLDWTMNSSSAVLDLPTGSTILHAELIWSGSYGFDPAIPLSLADTPVTFITPGGPQTITPNPSTAQSRVNSGSTGFYVRSADVTSFITGAGTYTVAGVPATVIATENNLNCAGWTLAVVYQNSNMYTSNLTLFIGCEAQGSAPAVVSGFRAPDNGTFSSRLFCCSLEGDAQLTGDNFLVGATSTLSAPGDAVVGTNNPLNNFFASQINTLLPLTTDVTTGKLVASGSSQLDTRGTFGSLNSIASSGTAISGARQGYDITSIDLGNKIQNSQQQLFAQGTTNQDVYTVTGLGIQIQVLSPLINSQKQVDTTAGMLHQILTYTITLTNIGESDASNLVLIDPLPTGLTLTPNSITVNGTPISNPDLVNGVSIGNLAVSAMTVITYQAEISQVPPTSFTNTGTINYSFIPFSGTTPIALQSQTNPVTVTVTVTPPVANPDTGTTNANTPFNGPTVLSNDTGTSLVVSSTNTSSTLGHVTMQSTGIYVYTPPANFSGTDSFMYTIEDILNQTSTTTVTLTVLPIAINDTGTVTANTSLTQNTSVLNNDEGTALFVSSNTSPMHGTVTMHSDGTYIYTPSLDFSGVDTFDYTATDQTGNTTTALVTITVLPVAENDFGTTPANTPLNGSTVFTNDQGMGLTIVSYDHTSTQGGGVVMNTTTGTYTYTPPNGFSGVDTFTYTVQDSHGDTSVATVTITVLPTAVNDAGITQVNTPLNQMVSVLTNDIGTSLSVTSSTHITSVQNATITIQPNGTYVYTPPLNFSGIDSFVYTATDGNGNSASASVRITVLPHAMNDTAITHANTTLVGTSVLSNDTGSTLTIFSYQSTSAQGGTVSMNLDGTYTYIPPTGFSGIDTFNYVDVDSSGDMTSGMVTITVLPVALNDVGLTHVNTPLNGASVLTNDIGSGLSISSYNHQTTAGGTVVMNLQTGTYTYTPPIGFTGIDTFTYTVIDSTGNTATATVLISVLPISTPKSFTGKIKKCKLLNKTSYSLKAHWTASPDQNIVLYRIYHNGKIVAQFSPSSPFIYETCLHSQKSGYEYFITAVNTSNVESSRLKITILH